MQDRSKLLMRWSIRLLLLLSLLPTMGSPVASAAAPVLGGEWDLSFEVRESKIRAIWTGRVWDYAEGDGVLVAQKRVDVSAGCQTFGGPVFGKSDVSFDGVDDYITCQLPDYQQIFEEMEPGLTGCRCQYESPPYASADVSPALGSLLRPIVYHERLRLDIFQDPAIGTGAFAHLSLHFNNAGDQQWQSNSFNAWQKNGFQLWAGYDAAGFVSKTKPEGWAQFLGDSGFWKVVDPGHADGILLWESETSVNFSAQALPSGFGLGPGTTVYFGHNPETGVHYPGKMRTVAVDPGCRAH